MGKDKGCAFCGLHWTNSQRAFKGRCGIPINWDRINSFRIFQIYTTSGSEQFPWALHLLLWSITGCPCCQVSQFIKAKVSRTTHLSTTLPTHLYNHLTTNLSTHLPTHLHTHPGCAWVCMCWFHYEPVPVSLELLSSSPPARRPVGQKDSQTRVHKKSSFENILSWVIRKFPNLGSSQWLYDFKFTLLSEVWFGRVLSRWAGCTHPATICVILFLGMCLTFVHLSKPGLLDIYLVYFHQLPYHFNQTIIIGCNPKTRYQWRICFSMWSFLCL